MLKPSDLFIEPAGEEQLSIIQHIVDITWPVAYKDILSKDQLVYMLDLIYSSEALDHQIKNGHFFSIAYHSNTAIGFSSFSQIGNTNFKLHKLYVLPASQKTGAGKALLKNVEERVKTLGATTLSLNVNRNNPAKIFYEKNGFRVIHEEDIDIGSGYFMNDYVLEKSL